MGSRSFSHWLALRLGMGGARANRGQMHFTFRRSWSVFYLAFGFNRKNFPLSPRPVRVLEEENQLYNQQHNARPRFGPKIAATVDIHRTAGKHCDAGFPAGSGLQWALQQLGTMPGTGRFPYLSRPKTPSPEKMQMMNLYLPPQPLAVRGLL